VLKARLRALTLAIAVGSSGAAGADERLDEAKALIDEGRAKAAYEVLAPLEDTYAGTPEYDYLLGISALDAGLPGPAVFALERVLAVEPDNDLARAEIARAYYLLSEYETAEREFETVRKSSSIPQAARPRIDDYLSRIAQARGEGGLQVSGYFTFGAGYDSNVNSGTAESQVIIPIFANQLFQLVDDARETEGAYTLVAAGVNLAQEVAEGVSVLGGARGYWRNTESPFSTQDAYLYGGVGIERGRHSFVVAAQGETFQVDADALRNTYGGFGQWTYELSTNQRVTLAGQINQIDYPDFNNRNATRYVASLGWAGLLPGERAPSVFLGVYGGIEDENEDRFPQFGHDFYGARAGGSISLLPRLRTFGSLGIEERNYGGRDTIFDVQRDDTQYNLSAGFVYQLFTNWQVRPNMTFTRNESNVPINDYTRVIGGIDVTARF